MTNEMFEHIARELRPRLLSVGRQFFGNDNMAEDIAQEALMRLWLVRSKIDLQAGIQPLALRLAKNLCVSEWRRRQVRQTAIPSQQETTQPETVTRRMEAEEDVRRLWVAVSRLMPAEQRLFRMRYELEMDLAQITAVTGLGPRSVSAMLSAAKRKILEMLNEKGSR